MSDDHFEPMSLFLKFLNEFQDEEENYKYRELTQQMIENEKISLQIDFNDLYQFNQKLAEELLYNPREFIDCGNDVLAALVENLDNDYCIANPAFFIRFYNLPENNRIPLSSLRSEHTKMLISVKGLIIKMTKVKPLLLEGCFKCDKCREISFKKQESYIYSPPTLCSNPNCNNKRSFTLLPEDSKYSNYQEIILQEWSREPVTGIVKKLEVELVHDLVETCAKNQIVVITGILTLIQKSKKSAEFKKRFIANGIRLLDVKII